MSSNFDGHSSATNPQFASPSSPTYAGGMAGDPHYNAFGANASGYGHGNATPTGSRTSPMTQSYGTTGYTSPPTVSVTDYGSASYPPMNGTGPDNQGYEEDYGMPTDFDALFSGKSRPGVIVSGMEGVTMPSGKANQVLGINEPHSLVYENSGFSRNVHFDPSSLPGGEFEQQAEHYAKKRRGFLPSFMSFDTSESLPGGSKKTKSLFLSKGRMSKNDRWLEWSEKMRVEAQVKKEEFVRKQEEAAKNKLPTPIRKARQESVKFVSNSATLVEEETPLSKALQAMEQATPAKSDSTVLSKEQIRDRYTEAQWERLHAYWGHQLFRKCRPAGYIIAFLAMLSAIPPVLSTRWVTYNITVETNFTYTLAPDQPYLLYPIYNCSTTNVNGTCYETYDEFSHIEIQGFWYNCTENITTYSGINDPACIPIDFSGKNNRWLGLWVCCYEDLLQGVLTAEKIDSGGCKITINNLDGLPKWQSAILGLLLFSLAAGAFASFLTTWGVCATSLARKVYFYHSAGEIYFVCGICSTAALISFPAVLESAQDNVEHEYGIGYFLGWGMPFCYIVSAICMTLDDMIHSITNDCCLFCRRKKVAKEPLTSASV